MFLCSRRGLPTAGGFIRHRRAPGTLRERVSQVKFHIFEIIYRHYTPFEGMGGF